MKRPCDVLGQYWFNREALKKIESAEKEKMPTGEIYFLSELIEVGRRVSNPSN